MNGPYDTSDGTETLEGFSDWSEIGRGGDATVYRAIQDALQREVAIKVLMVDDEESVRRFTREVQLMVSLGRQHPNIAKVLQIGTSSRGRPCIVMDFYELGSLDQRLAAYGQLAADEVVQVGTVVADALAFAHGKGVLHRDVKPQNILILPTSYVLSDFGIARLIDSAHTASTDRFSYRHASPQVLEGAPPSEADDVFSLGATLFHLLDGKPPFTLLSDEPDSALAYIRRVQTQAPRQLRRTDLPPGLVAIIDTALQKDPAYRFQSAADLRDALADVRTEARAWASGGPSMPHLPANPTPTSANTGSWGGVPGRTHDPVDLTSMRLMGSAAEPTNAGYAPTGYAAALPGHGHAGVSARSALSASAPPAGSHPYGAEPDQPRGMPLLAFALAGTTVGVIVVLVWFVLQRTATQATPPPTATPTAVAARHDPNLTPRNISVTDRGSSVEVKWDFPIKTPEWYSVGRGRSRAQIQPVGKVSHPERSRVVAVDPKERNLCFSVTGVGSDGGLGPSAPTCIRE
ncbi:serine/threonine-protein kinase [Mariniluteicoccus flavus]